MCPTTTNPGWQVSFVIPAMNEEQMLVRALDSIRALQTLPDWNVLEVIVVDAGSTDTTPDIARAAGCRVVTAPPGNVSASRNRGADVAAGNVLAFIDADCELPATWLQQTAAELAQPDTVAVGMHMAAPATDATWVERTWYRLAHRSSESSAAESVCWLATFNLAVHAQQFRTVGGFDESLITCEDVDLGYRLSQHGLLRRIGGRGVIHHGESRTVREFFRREAWRARGNRTLLQHSNHPLRELVSSLLPFGVIGTLVLGAASAAWLGAGALVSLLPLVLLALRRRPTVQQLPACVVLLAVYFAARCRGMLHPASRVERRDGSRLPAESPSDAEAGIPERSLSPSTPRI